VRMYVGGGSSLAFVTGRDEPSRGAAFMHLSAFICRYERIANQTAVTVRRLPDTNPMMVQIPDVFVQKDSLDVAVIFTTSVVLNKEMETQ